jgi:hypothetical protein
MIMKKVFVLCMIVLSLIGCDDTTKEPIPEPKPDPIMWAVYLKNGSSKTAAMWIDPNPDADLPLPDGIAAVCETKLIDYVRQGSHLFYAESVPYDGGYWMTTEYMTEDYTFSIID